MLSIDRWLFVSLLMISRNFFAVLNVILFGELMRTLYYFFADAALIALRSIYAQKLRTFLTLIGIIIGVSSVVVVGASISGFNDYVLSTVSGFWASITS